MTVHVSPPVVTVPPAEISALADKVSDLIQAGGARKFVNARRCHRYLGQAMTSKGHNQAIALRLAEMEFRRFKERLAVRNRLAR